MDYLSRMKARLEGGEEGVPLRLGDKRALRQFADLIGVRTPQVHFVAKAPGLAEVEFPTEFVLKPCFASTSVGVRLLQSAGDGFLDLLTGSTVTLAEVQERCAALSEEFFGDANRGDYIIEQLLRDCDGNTPPADVRFYAFQGDMGLILKEDHLAGGVTRSMYFDGDFLPFADVSARYSIAERAAHLEAIVDARTPRNWRELLAVARRVSVAVPTAFCRVDLYDTVDGVYLGEITLYPGTFYYQNRKLMSVGESERLGRLWEDAAKRLRGSRLSPRQAAGPAELGAPRPA